MESRSHSRRRMTTIVCNSPLDETSASTHRSKAIHSTTSFIPTRNWTESRSLWSPSSRSKTEQAVAIEILADLGRQYQPEQPSRCERVNNLGRKLPCLSFCAARRWRVLSIRLTCEACNEMCHHASEERNQAEIASPTAPRETQRWFRNECHQQRQD